MSISAMKQALEVLEELNEVSKGPSAICLPAEIDTAMDALQQAIAEAEDAVAAEREACAKLVEADGLARGKAGLVFIKAAARIRARGEK